MLYTVGEGCRRQWTVFTHGHDYEKSKGAPIPGAGTNRQKLSIQRALWRALGPLAAEEPGVALSRATRDGKQSVARATLLPPFAPTPVVKFSTYFPGYLGCNAMYQKRDVKLRQLALFISDSSVQYYE